jgi:hypothetical protein
MALTPIRPPITPQGAAAARPAADAARAAAQKAFFQAAMGGVEAPSTPAPRPVDAVQAASRFTPQAAQRAAIPDEPPRRVLRPGSFIDIKV